MSIPKEDKHHTTALTDIYDAIKGTWSPNEKQHHHLPALHTEEMPPLQPKGWRL
jgi:hypothetical protein